MASGRDETSDDVIYFAYGSNMFTPRLRFRVPGAAPLTTGRLENSILKFNKRSNLDFSSKCNIASSQDHSVFGVLFTIPRAELADLHRAEGRGKGYDDLEVDIVNAQGLVRRALTYSANESHIEERLAPYNWYWDFVVSGAREHGLPDTYVADFILSVKSLQDPDAKREQKERAKIRV